MPASISMAMSEQQEHRSPQLETARASSNPYEPQLPRSGPMTGGSAATSMVTVGDMAGDGAACDNVRRSSSPWAALLSILSPYNRVSISSLIVSPGFQRKRRSHVPRAVVPSHKWAGVKIPVLPPAPAKKEAIRRKRNSKEMKKRDTPCVLCGAAETPLWRTWPTDRRVVLCNACGIQVRQPGMVLPELVYLPHPATATKTVISELKQPVPPLPQEIQPDISDFPRAVLPSQVRVNLPPPAMPKSWVTSSAMASSATTTVVPEVEQPRLQEIQESESPPDSPILESMLNADIYLVKRTLPRRDKSPPPPPPPTPPTAEPEPAAAVPAPGNEEAKQAERKCQHCEITCTMQWRTGPDGERTLCNACGVNYKKGRLVPEYRPKASPTFNEAKHSNLHSEVLQLRQMQDNPAPPPPYLPVKPRMKRRKNKGQQQQLAQARKKHKTGNNSNKAQNQQPAQAQPAAVAVVHQVHDDDEDDDDEHLRPEPALMKLRKQLKSTEHRRGPPQPAAAQPRVGDDMVQQQHLPPPPPPPELPQAAADNDMDLMAGCLRLQDLLQPLPPAQPHDDGDDLVIMAPPDPFLLDGPPAPMIIEENRPRVVIVIDDD